MIEPEDLGLASPALVRVVVPPAQRTGPAPVERLNGFASEPAQTNLPVGRPIALEELERQHILEVLRSTGGNRTQAATILKISIRTLRNKLNDYKVAGWLSGNLANEDADALMQAP